MNGKTWNKEENSSAFEPVNYLNSEEKLPNQVKIRSNVKGNHQFDIYLLSLYVIQAGGLCAKSGFYFGDIWRYERTWLGHKKNEGTSFMFYHLN